MSKRLYLIAIACVAVAVFGIAQQPNKKIVIPVNQTASTSGQQMYASYCAPCHGVKGKGHGPAASALKMPPTDLTLMSKKNNGRYPDTHVTAVLEFGAETPAHGSAEMPVWGPIFGKMNRANSQERQLRISNLSSYLESIQAK